jgi:hypothetical protein
MRGMVSTIARFSKSRRVERRKRVPCSAIDPSRSSSHSEYNVAAGYTELIIGIPGHDTSCPLENDVFCERYPELWIAGRTSHTIQGDTHHVLVVVDVQKCTSGKRIDRFESRVRGPCRGEASQQDGKGGITVGNLNKLGRDRALIHTSDETIGVVENQSPGVDRGWVHSSYRVDGTV